MKKNPNKSKRQFKQLTLDNRILIEICYQDGCSLRTIAQEIKRPVSAVSRKTDGRP